MQNKNKLITILVSLFATGLLVTSFAQRDEPAEGPFEDAIDSEGR
jgi:hypothetical protein